MARFIGRVRGGRGEVTRLGGTASGIEVVANGWDVGVRVVGDCRAGGDDVFLVYATGGSNARTSSKVVATISRDGPNIRVETPEQCDARLEREAVAKAQVKEPELVPGAREAGRRMLAHRPLLADEVAALKRYASANGRTWKSILLHAWQIADATLPGPVYSLRNSHGPSWLVAFKLPDAAREAAKRLRESIDADMQR